MSIWTIMLACIGLSLDDFILMMGKGATLKDLTAEKTVSYAGIFGMTNMTTALLGYLFSSLFENMLMFKLNATLCSLIFMLLGLLFVHKAVTKGGIVEKLDLTFDWKQCAKIAILTNLTTFFFGVGNGLMNTSLIYLLLCAFVTCFAAVTIALRIGYNYGYAHARIIHVIGGTLLMLMAFNIWSRFLR